MLVENSKVEYASDSGGLHSQGMWSNPLSSDSTYSYLYRIAWLCVELPSQASGKTFIYKAVQVAPRAVSPGIMTGSRQQL